MIQENTCGSYCRDLTELPVILRVCDLQHVLGISRNTAYRLIREKRIRSIRIGSAIRVPRTAIIEFLTEPEA